jgi:hypothetical protein
MLSRTLSTLVAWIAINRELDLRKIIESVKQQDNNDDSRISTFREISIDLSDDSRNADDSTRTNRFIDSKK